MNKSIIKIFILISIILIVNGCSYTKNVKVHAFIDDKKRVDQEVGGILGNWENSPGLKDSDRKETRKVFVMEVTKNPQDYKGYEFVNILEDEGDYQINKFDEPKKKAVKMPPEPPDIDLPPFDDDFNIEEKKKMESSDSFIKYKVEKNDTLQKISKKFFNSYSKWSKIYEVNKDRIKNPDSIKPGIILRIPTEK